MSSQSVRRQFSIATTMYYSCWFYFRFLSNRLTGQIFRSYSAGSGSPGGQFDHAPHPQSCQCIHCGQLILGKISKIGATRCQILRLKCTKFDFRLRSTPDTAGGDYSAAPDPLVYLMGPTSKGRKGEVRGRGREGRGKGKGEGKGRGGLPPLSPPNWGVWIRQCGSPEVNV